MEALITAGGSSRRLGGGMNKLFVTICGMPVLMHSVLAFSKCPSISSITIAAEARLHPMIRTMLASWSVKGPVRLAPGGETRQRSVANMLAMTDPDTDAVCVHDGARPMLCAADLEAMAKAFINGSDDGLVSCSRVSDTLKRIGPDGLIELTVPRDNLIAVQTPQIFRRGFLMAALEAAEADGYEGTDESSLAERLGGRTRAYFQPAENLKITYEKDVETARTLMEFRGSMHGRQ